MSACVGLRDWMDCAWPPSNGEAIHTSTFLGHPVGCAMALAQIREITRLKLVERSARLGKQLLVLLDAAVRMLGCNARCRGLGLMAGIEFRSLSGAPDSLATLSLVKRLLNRRLILLPEGEHGNVLGLTPPLTIAEHDLRRAVEIIRDEVCSLYRGYFA